MENPYSWYENLQVEKLSKCREVLQMKQWDWKYGNENDS